MAALTYEQALDRCEDEISSIDEAIDYLREVRDMDDVIDDLLYRRNALCEEAEGYRKEIDAEWKIEQGMMNREYERDLL